MTNFNVGYRRITSMADADEYIAATQRVVIHLESLFHEFGLKPSYNTFTVRFDQECSTYQGNGEITIEREIDLKNHVLGGLFHETIHGSLENFGHKYDHWIPESWARIIQHHVLTQRVQTDEARRKASSLEYSTDGSDDADACKSMWDFYLNTGIRPVMTFVERLPSHRPRISQAGSERAFLKNARMLAGSELSES